jgi:predicted nucleic acid-binding protein
VGERSVKITAALQGVARLFLDTAPVIYYVEQNPAYAALVDDIFHRIDSGTLQAITSPITLAECLVVPIRQGLHQTQQDFTDLIVCGANVTFLTLAASAAHRAAELRARYNIGLLDAFQVSIALAGGANAFLTNDRILLRVQELPILILDDLEL